jgi:uncharacterized membrane protein YqjE
MTMAGPSAMPPPEPGRGLFQSLQRLLSTLLEIVQVRLDLAVNEFEQEKLRIFDALAWASVALLFIALGLLLGVAMMVVLTPEAWRPLVLALLALGCLAVGAGLFNQARLRLRNPGGALPATRAELAHDQAGLDQTPPA